MPTPEPLQDAAITDFITNAIIYKPADGQALGLGADGDRRDGMGHRARADRPDVHVRQAVRHGRREPLQVEERHRPDTGARQDAFNEERVEQAKSLLTFANSITKGRKTDVYLVGDFNSYAKEDPIKVFTDAAGATCCSRGQGQYTYTFDGELGSLDHVIASPAATDKVNKAGGLVDQLARVGGREYRAPRPRPARRSARATTTRSSSASSAEGGPGTVDIDLVTVNDFHGRIEQSAPSGGIARCPPRSSRSAREPEHHLRRRR